VSSIRLFRTFVAVARCGSFAAASERVSLTAAAVGLQMKTLEDELGQVLFDRTGKVVSLSVRGHRLLPRAEKLLACYGELFDDTQDALSMEGSMTIGTVGTSMGLLTHAVLALRSSHPKLNIHPTIFYSADMSTRIIDGELDAAIMIKSSHKAPAGTHWTPLHEEPFVFIANRATSDGVDVKTLLRQRLFLRPSRATNTGALIDSFMQRAKLKVYDVLEINSLRSMVELVKQDTGVTIVPLTRAADWESDRKLRVIRFSDRQAVRVIGFMERESRRHLTSVLRQALLEIVKR
jgi:DNA-binding transcriptional LysR family regulator